MLLLEGAIYVDPVTLNSAYPTNRGGHRYLSPEGVFYKEAIKQCITEDFLLPADDPMAGFELELAFFIPKMTLFTKAFKWRKIDLSNLIKLTEDAITEKIGIDDSRISSIRVKKVPTLLESSIVYFQIGYNQSAGKNSNFGTEPNLVEIREPRWPCTVCKGTGSVNAPEGYIGGPHTCPLCGGSRSYTSARYSYNPQEGTHELPSGKRCCGSAFKHVRKHGPYSFDPETIAKNGWSCWLADFTILECMKCGYIYIPPDSGRVESNVRQGTLSEAL